MASKALSANEAWLKLLNDLVKTGTYSTPRGKPTLELLGHQTRINMTCPVVTTTKRKLGYRFLPAEAAWILSGDNRVETIAPYGKHIAQFSDNGSFFEGAYGPQIIDQLSYVLSALGGEDVESRQAVMTTWKPRPRPSKDIPCTVALQWLVRPLTTDQDDLGLHCFVTMRSSDAWLGWPYDVFNFSMLSAYLACLLEQRYQRPLSLGDLCLTAGSQHIYEVNQAGAKACLNAPSSNLVYAPFNHHEFADNPGNLIRHLRGLADRRPSSLYGSWLTELLTDDL